ncbi:hypothetical protein NDU88_006826 [Pleurodeles waltl]|uniref:Uncharacterized protein n=1 Tax=Pleurodeles waltl TaxID=8319 RepID=A0AAV7WFL0_PLEWA|nr:hypothetical protein NDU88_006826 [Pleurodeles waltl]
MAAVLTPSLLLLLLNSITAHPGPEEPTDSGGPERCKSPFTIWSRLILSPTKLWYDRGERIQVKCFEGYQPSTSEIECRQKTQSSASEWDVEPTCVQRCKNPNTHLSVLILSPSKEWYDRGERVQVACSAGYKPRHSSIECRQRLWGSASEWDVKPSCIQRCQKPTGDTTLHFSPPKEWYDRGDWVHVTCAAGYQTLTPDILCRERDASSASEWDEAPTCIEIKQTNLAVSSSSITLTLTCGNDDCQRIWKTSATCSQISCCANRCPTHVIHHECAVKAHDNSIKETAITCVGLLPFTEYIVAVYGTREHLHPDRYFLLYDVTVTTDETVPDAPEIEWFNATTKTIKWKKLSECNGAIKNYQLNITAWRDYNKTFLETEIVTVNSSVTEYTFGRYDTNYTARIQGLTSAGLGQVLLWTFSTKISGPPNEDHQAVSQEESLEPFDPLLSSKAEVTVSPMDGSDNTPAILARERNLRGYPNHFKVCEGIEKSIHTFQEGLEKKMDSLVGVMNVLNQKVMQIIGSQQTLTRDLSTALSRFTDILNGMKPTSSLFSTEATRSLATTSKTTAEKEGESEDGNRHAAV